MNQTAQEILDATHADVIVESPATGQAWTVAAGLQKAHAEQTAVAVFDALTLARAGNRFRVTRRFYRQEAAAA